MKSCFVDKSASATQYLMPLYHSHHYYELYLLAEGQRSIYIENEEYPMLQSDILLIPNGVLHRTEGALFTRYLVNFTPEYLDEEQKKVVKILQQQRISLTKEERKTIFPLLEKMHAMQNGENFEVNEKDAYDFRVCFSYFLFLLAHCKNFPQEGYKRQKQYNLRTKKIMHYIQTNYSEKITLDSLSKIFFLSKAALCADFKKNTDMSIIDYLLKTRIKNAQLLLAESDKSINAIAEACGFSSAKYFYLIFTKFVKASPSEYRKSLKVSISDASSV